MENAGDGRRRVERSTSPERLRESASTLVTDPAFACAVFPSPPDPFPTETRAAREFRH